ncbi:hypothetical protein AK812_SmicGene7003 [Symbiodinium microadriaticum]|uniref:Uncharacterized protein n=1 Tax=Symbiodinium microadriaticum TaxID=2951 RepID=A0A1Q9EPN9_SYMMI|nr:hypothetical protein AK812_SmicGene7003 [Symbiodinium microadriaticum]
MRPTTAALLWIGTRGADLRLERRGQDTFVLHGDEVVFTTSVDDTSAGSDTDSDIKGDEEFFHGCLWTYRQQVSLCQGGSCGEAEILAHDFQRHLLAFYTNRSGTAPPPLEAASWLVLATSPEQRREEHGTLLDLCTT